jgi:hypothetical protein
MNLKYLFDISIDTEFEGKLPISLQVFVKVLKNSDKYCSFCFIVFNSLFSNIFENISFSNFEGHTVYLYWHNFELEPDNILTEYLFRTIHIHYNLQIESEKINIFSNLYVFYSIRDLRIAFGDKYVMDLGLKDSSKGFYKKQYLSQRKSYMKGMLYGSTSIEFQEYHIYYNIRDIFGWHTTGGLDAIITSLGLEIFQKYKSLMSPYKSEMSKAVQEHPVQFLEYSISDAVVLQEIVDKMVSFTNSIQSQVYGITDNKYLFTKYSISYSLGALVNRIFVNYLDFHFFENNCIYKIVFLKHGILNEKHPLYSTALEYLKKLYEFQSLEEFEKFSLQNQEYFEKMCEVLFKRSLFKYNPLNYSSIKWLMDISTFSNAFVCSLICVGRTVNERPQTYFSKSIGDIDISSAYGSQLIKVQFLLDRPRIYFKTANDFSKITLGSFLKKYFHKFSTFKMLKVMVHGN